MKIHQNQWGQLRIEFRPTHVFKVTWRQEEPIKEMKKKWKIAKQIVRGIKERSPLENHTPGTSHGPGLHDSMVCLL